jgi:hypothetical protein
MQARRDSGSHQRERAVQPVTAGGIGAAAGIGAAGGIGAASAPGSPARPGLGRLPRSI